MFGQKHVAGLAMSMMLRQVLVNILLNKLIFLYRINILTIYSCSERSTQTEMLHIITHTCQWREVKYATRHESMLIWETMTHNKTITTPVHNPHLGVPLW